MRYPLGLLLILVALSGCGPQLSKEELGSVVFEVPKLAGSDEPYKMPQLGPPLERKDDFDGPRLR
jgi:hypothetical protein